MFEVNDLLKSFGGVTAIANLGFQVPEGQVYSVIGPNGAGKTTLFNLLCGIYQPDEGEICFEGKVVTGLAPFRIARLGVSRTFQNLQVFFNMTALENVLVGCHLRTSSSLLQGLLRVPRVRREEQQVREWSTAALEFCGLGKYLDQQADALPYGVLKRLEIARALASQPRLLLLDEPAAGLNDTETADMLGLIRRISESGITVLLVEHNMNLVMKVSDRILVLNYGSRLAEGSPQEIQQNDEVISAYLGGEVRYAV